MPFTFTGTARRKRLGVMLAVSVIFFLAVLISAFYARELMLQYGMFFISGILLMGVWLRTRQLLKLTPDTCSFDNEGISWEHSGEQTELSWQEISRCMLITGKGVHLHLKATDGATRHVPTDCLPETPEELLEVLQREVMPACGWITFSLNNEILQGRQKE